MAVDILVRVFKTSAYADILLEHTFAQSSLDPADRSLVKELVFGTLRWQKRLDFIASSLYNGPWQKVPDSVKNVLLVSLYQLDLMDKIPAYAVIHEAVNMAKLLKGPYWGKVVNAMLRTRLRNPEAIRFPECDQDPVRSIAIQYSHPEWLVGIWLKQFGPERTQSICMANNERPPVSFRVNRLRHSSQQDILEWFGGDPENPPVPSILPDYYTIHSGGNIAETDAFRKGGITIQDTAAGFAALALDPMPGEVIVDMAAAPGGKTTHLAERTGDKSFILAADRNLTRLALIRDHMHRLGLHSIRTIQADGRHFPARRADRVLLDAPCSGIGVIRKRAELRWSMSPEIVKNLAELQKQLLCEAARLVKPGGVLVYSTCTLLNEENREVVLDFLKKFPQFIRDELPVSIPDEVRTQDGWIEVWPDLHQMDGAFVARLKHME